MELVSPVPAETRVHPQDIRSDPLTAAGVSSLEREQLNDLEAISSRINQMRRENRRKNTSKTYQKCWKLWEVS